MRKDQANTMPPHNSSNGFMPNGNRTDSPDMENEGGNIPNVSIQWRDDWMDRMIGSRPNTTDKPSIFKQGGNQTEYIDPTKR